MIKFTGSWKLGKCVGLIAFVLSLGGCYDVSDWGVSTKSSSSSSSTSEGFYAVGGKIAGLKIQNGPITLLLNNSAATALQVYLNSDGNCVSYTPSLGGSPITASPVGGACVFKFADSFKLKPEFGYTVGVPTSAITSLSMYPTGQTCTFSTNSKGNISATAPADISDIVVTCSDVSYYVGGDAKDLKGVVVLQNKTSSGTYTLTLGSGATATQYGPGSVGDGNNSFKFSNGLPLVDVSGVAQTYEVSIVSQSDGLNCVVANGKGSLSVANPADVTNVQLNCNRSAYPITANVSGLVTGSTLSLSNTVTSLDIDNAQDGIQPYVDSKSASNGANTFTSLKTGEFAKLKIDQQPNGQTCQVTGATGGLTASAALASFTGSIAGTTLTVTAVAAGLVTPDMAVSGGTVTTGTTIVKQLTGDAGGVGTYQVSVSKTVASATLLGTAPINTVVAGNIGVDAVSVDIACAPKTLTITGANDSGATVSISGSSVTGQASQSTATISFSAKYGDVVTLTATKAGYLCSVSGSPITVSENAVADVSCVPQPFKVGGTVTGYVAGSSYSNPILQLNGASSYTITESGSFEFAGTLTAGTDYAVTLTQAAPAGGGVPVCNLFNSTGTLFADVTNVLVACSSENYEVGGTVSGLTGSVTLLNNGSDATTVTSNGLFKMNTAVGKNLTYDVSVGTQPATQTCLVSSGSGTVATQNITSVTVSCDNGTVGGTVTGLSDGETLSLTTNGATATVTGTGSSVNFAIAPTAGAFTSGTNYNVTIQGQSPTGKFCLVSNASGTIEGVNVTNVVVTCDVKTYTVGGVIILADPQSALPDAGMGLSVNLSYTLGANDACVGTTTSGVCNNSVELNSSYTSTACAKADYHLDTATGAPTTTDTIRCVSFSFPNEIHYQSPTLTQVRITTPTEPWGLICTLYNYNSGANAGAGSYAAASGNPVGISVNVGSGQQLNSQPQNSTNAVYYCVHSDYSITGTVTGLPSTNPAATTPVYNPIQLQVVTNDNGTTNTYVRQFTANGAYTLGAPTAWSADTATADGYTSRTLATANSLIYNPTTNQLFSVGASGTCASPGITAPSVTAPAAGSNAGVGATLTGLVNCPVDPTPTNGAYPYTPVTGASYTYAGVYNAADYSKPFTFASGTEFTASLVEPLGSTVNKTGNLKDPSGKNPMHYTCLLTAPGAYNVTDASGKLPTEEGYDGSSIKGTISNGTPNITVTCTAYEVAITVPFIGYASGGTFTVQATAKLTGTAGPNYSCDAAQAPACQLVTLTSSGAGSGTATFTKYLAVGTPWSLEITQPTISTPRTCTLYNSSGTTTTSAISHVYVNCTLQNPSDSFMFVANESNNTVSQYTFDLTTSALTANVTTPVVTGQGTTNFDQPTGIAVLATGMNAYVLNKNNAKIYNFSVAAKSLGTTVGAATTAVGGVPYAIAAMPNGMGLYVTDNQGGVVYGYSIVGGNGKGQAQALTIPYYVTGTGAPNALLGTSGSGPRGIAFHPNSSYAYVVNGGDNTLSQFSIGGSGLSPLGAMGAGGVVNNTVAVGSDPYYVAVDPSGRYLYVTNKGDNTISQFNICQVGNVTDANCVANGVGSVTPMTPATVAVPAIGPVAITASDSAVFVTTSDGNVAQFVIGTDGTLSSNTSLNAGIIAAGTNPKGIYAGFGTTFGQRVYVTNQGSDSISSFLLDTGASIPYPLISGGDAVTTVPTGGTGPTGPTGFAVFK